MSESSNFQIKSSTGNYIVNIGINLVKPGSFLWLIDANVAQLYKTTLPTPAIIQEALEAEKSLFTVESIIKQMRDHSSTRKTVLAAVGGGIIQDVVTFAASCYMRGIEWVLYPTTLLSMVDSCLGGKSSLNVGTYKNIVGNFYPPTAIYIDPRFCKTLSDEQMVEGLCEAAKICWADSFQSFSRYLALVDSPIVLKNDPVRLSKLIEHSLLTKKRFIEEDEFDKGIRLLLNFGHTFGHAIESASNFSISHGVSVGLGMVCAINFSHKFGLLEKDNKEVTKLTTHLFQLLEMIDDLQDRLKVIETKRAVDAFISDKKHTSDFFIIILLENNCSLVRKQLTRDDKVFEELHKTFELIFRNYHEI